MIWLKSDYQPDKIKTFIRVWYMYVVVSIFCWARSVCSAGIAKNDVTVVCVKSKIDTIYNLFPQYLVLLMNW